jgi:GT2 family glycosyltransferase
MIENMLDRLEALAQQSVTMQQNGDFAGALAGYEVILGTLLSYEGQGCDTEAGKILRLLFEAQHSPVLVLHLYALSLYCRRQYQDAYKVLNTALLLDPDSPQLQYFKARIMDVIGNTEGSAPISDGKQEALFLSTAETEMPGVDYYGWLQRLHELLQPATYVEIGLGDGRALSLTGPKTRAIGIDPYKGKWEQLNYGSPHGTTTLFSLTSDNFFAQHDLRHILGKETFDLAFIDGLHHFDQALKDFINLERYAGKNSIILLHDCLPVSPLVATRERNTAFWTGDVWRIIPCLKTFRPDLRIITIPAKPSGLTVVTGLDPESNVLSEHYETIVKYYAGLNLPTSMSERFSLLNVQRCDLDEVVNEIVNKHKPHDVPMPKVSVINVICGNNVGFMGKCLESLINNTDYPNVEFVIVTDSDGEMKNYISNIAGHNPAIKCVYRNERHSNASNRNSGALNASPDSKYYLFADSDVMYSNKQWLKDMVNILEANDDMGMIGGGDGSTLGHYGYINEERGVLINVVHDFKDFIPKTPLEMMIIPGYNMLMRREMFVAIGGWDEGFTPVYGEDIDICLRCILAGYRIFGIYNKGVHHLYRDTKENNSSELLVSDVIQTYLNLASIRRLALKYEGLLPTKNLGSFQEWFDAIKHMRDCGPEYSRRVKKLPPTVVDGKINRLYLPLTDVSEASKIYDAISFDW